MALQFLECERRDRRFCTIAPLVAAAGIGAVGSLASGGLSFLGQNAQSKAIRKAMERYINEVNMQRQTFLNQPESQAIRKKLEGYIGGEEGYNPNIVGQMRAGVTEDYGKSLSDMTRLTRKGGAGASGVMTTGRADRTSRLLGQNIASNRATAMRDISTKNAEVALNNQRFAVSALPTYMPGIPATQVPGPDVYAQAGQEPSPFTYLGQSVGNIANTAGQYALFSQLANMSPVSQRMMMWDPVMGTGTAPGGVPSDYASYYRNLSPTR